MLKGDVLLREAAKALPSGVGRVWLRRERRSAAVHRG
jgi:hypothetical protein